MEILKNGLQRFEKISQNQNMLVRSCNP